MPIDKIDEELLLEYSELCLKKDEHEKVLAEIKRKFELFFYLSERIKC